MTDGHGPCRVVLCDDAVDFMRLVKLLLEIEKDLEVVGLAENGEEAIELCSELRPEVLLLDISMPVMDGLTALPEIRKVSPDTKVVVLSAFSSAAMKQKALKLGAAAFIEKGDDPTGLPERVRAHC